MHPQRLIHWYTLSTQTPRCQELLGHIMERVVNQNDGYVFFLPQPLSCLFTVTILQRATVNLPIISSLLRPNLCFSLSYILGNQRVLNVTHNPKLAHILVVIEFLIFLCLFIFIRNFFLDLLLQMYFRFLLFVSKVCVFNKVLYISILHFTFFWVIFSYSPFNH